MPNVTGSKRGPYTGKTMPRRPARSFTLARRNAAWYNAVRVKGHSVTRVAERAGVSKGLVSQVVNNPSSHRY